MNATQTPKSAAPSTPAAPPAASLAEGKLPKAAPAVPAQDADPEDFSQLDIAGALSQLSDDSKPAGEPAPDEADETETPEPASAGKDEPAPEAEPGEEEPDGELAEEPAAGDAAAEAAGDVENESPSEPAAEEAAKKKVTPAEQRIHELTARSKSAEEDLAKARERLASFEAENSGRLDAGALDHVDSLDSLAKQRAATVKLHQWALAHPMGGELADGKGAAKTYDEEGVRSLLSDTFGLINEAIPARESYLRSRSDCDAAAVNAYPWLKDTRTGAGAQVQALIEAMPAVRKLGPNYRVVAADAYVGQQLRDAGIRVDAALIARLKPTGAKGPGAQIHAPKVPLRKTPPPAPAPAGVIPGRVRADQAQGQAAGKRLSKGDGNLNDLTASIAAKFS